MQFVLAQTCKVRCRKWHLIFFFFSFIEIPDDYSVRTHTRLGSLWFIFFSRPALSISSENKYFGSFSSKHNNKHYLRLMRRGEYNYIQLPMAVLAETGAMTVRKQLRTNPNARSIFGKDDDTVIDADDDDDEKPAPLLLLLLAQHSSLSFIILGRQLV